MCLRVTLKTHRHTDTQTHRHTDTQTHMYTLRTLRTLQVPATHRLVVVVARKKFLQTLQAIAVFLLQQL